MKRSIVSLIVSISMTVGVIGIGATAAHADGNPMAGDAAYTAALYACRSFSDVLFVQGDAVSNPPAYAGVHLYDGSKGGWLMEAGNAYTRNPITYWANFYAWATAIMQHIESNGTLWSNSQFVSFENSLYSDCGSILPQSGSYTDYETFNQTQGSSSFRWNTCTAVTWSKDAGFDTRVDQAMYELGTITGVQVTQVAAGQGQIQFHWIAGSGGNTSVTATGVHMSSASVGIGSSNPDGDLAVIILHESGHAMGMTHPNHTGTVDNWPNETPSNNMVMHWIHIDGHGPWDYNNGDVQGLISLGVSQGC